MKKLSIKPVEDIIFLEIEQAKLGALDSSSVKTGMEWAIIRDFGPKVTGDYNIGDKIFVKGWAVDVIEYEGKPYYFTSEARKGICAIVTT